MILPCPWLKPSILGAHQYSSTVPQEDQQFFWPVPALPHAERACCTALYSPPDCHNHRQSMASFHFYACLWRSTSGRDLQQTPLFATIRAHHRNRTPLGLLIGTERLPCLSRTNLMVVGVDGSKAKGAECGLSVPSAKVAVRVKLVIVAVRSTIHSPAVIAAPSHQWIATPS